MFRAADGAAPLVKPAAKSSKKKSSSKKAADGPDYTKKGTSPAPAPATAPVPAPAAKKASKSKSKKAELNLDEGAADLEAQRQAAREWAAALLPPVTSKAVGSSNKKGKRAPSKSPEPRAKAAKSKRSPSPAPAPAPAPVPAPAPAAKKSKASPAPKGTFAIGSTVFVEERSEPGEKMKPGGVATVTAVEQKGKTITYEVVYVLGGREPGVPAKLLKAHSVETTGKRQRTPTAKVAEDEGGARKTRRR